MTFIDKYIYNSKIDFVVVFYAVVALVFAHFLPPPAPPAAAPCITGC
jgi:hypothetical protein